MSEYERPAAVSDEAAEAVDVTTATQPESSAVGMADGSSDRPADADATKRISTGAADRTEQPDPDATKRISTGAADRTEQPDPDATKRISTGGETDGRPTGTAAGDDPFAPDDEDELEDPPPIWAPGGARAPRSDDETAAPAAPAPRPALLRPRNLALIGLGAALLSVLGIFGPTAWEVWSERDVHLATPARINSLELDDSQGAHDTVDYMQNAIKTSVALDRTTGAVYAESSGDSKSVVFVGGTGTLVTPSEALDKSFGLITDEAGGVDSVHEVAAGPLGGSMKCGTTTTEGNPMAVCGWADHGSLGIAMFPNRQVNESAELLRTMRKAMQTRD